MLAPGLILLLSSCGGARGGGESSGGLATSGVEIDFENKMSGAFVLDGVEVWIGENPVGKLTEEADGISTKSELHLADDVLPKGKREVRLVATYGGNGKGIFSYLDDYRFRVESKYSWQARPMKTTYLKAICFEDGGVTTPLEDRPRIKWVETTKARWPGDGEAVADKGFTTGVSIF